MAAKIEGLKELQLNLKRLGKEVTKDSRKAVRKALNIGAKEVKKALKPVVPVMSQSTSFREKGVLKKNIRHKTKLKKNEVEGKTEIFFGNKNKSIITRERKRNRRTEKGTLLTGPVKVYVNDPYFWHMVDRGTKNGVKAQNFIKRTEISAKNKVENTVNEIFEEELKKVVQKYK
ncbi:HK97 gp10 family phage protein [Pasteurella caecimuris]|uniref:HK97-gp10 family putative phage morphogenesis protein n=1 Tax=Rodentibacter caecimuris TaxID=1796644 RepID=UPI00214F888A|nr:HK97-gp10 family putative phage morphogenesis protein [Pasteurella caecimuris]MCR1836994.1 HK97 gp10 family phage protein [Pasteurella caecimuris]MCU0107022.1 HK97 gp10 family phage protein [Pasteurella caecimuris]